MFEPTTVMKAFTLA